MAYTRVVIFPLNYLQFAAINIKYAEKEWTIYNDYKIFFFFILSVLFALYFFVVDC